MIVMARDANEYAGTRILLETLENSDEFKRASAVIDPLLNAIAELEANEERQREQKARGEAAINEARERARQKALAAAENDPEVVAAKNRLKSSRDSG